MSAARLALVPEQRAATEAAEVARARAWLPPRDDTMFDCYLGGIVANVADSTEADPLAVMATLLCAAGVYLGQGPHVRTGDDRQPALVWPMIVGRTNSGRKGSSYSTAKAIFQTAVPEFWGDNVRTGLTSGEGLAELFSETHHEATEDGTPRRAGGLPPGDFRLLDREVEWGGVMDKMKREGNSLSATLRAAWEGGDLSTMGVSARVAPTSHIGILAHITPEEFRAKVSASDMAGGTYNRFLPLAVARTRFLPNAPGMEDETRTQLAASLRDRLDHGTTYDRLAFTVPAAHLWHELYIEFGTDQDDDGGVINQFVSRAAPNCLRIATIYAVLDQADKIAPEHLAAAAALVRYSIATARAIFTDTETPRRLAAWIAEAGEAGRTREQIRSEYFQRNKTASEISSLLDQLTNGGFVTVSKRAPASGKGRPIEIFTATTPARG
ncbi:DUF3987 domain-containing protein [Sciscionella sediminilitoris]|uniref:DUF3987 domain-containing protein n=1 Tax=Sciscionella sediminilitoris TaxID=1445613 RepID=UPI00068DE9B6|nr:DUF3987 domain-containing protein [Sciscionella sp. SE31]